jgi:hypothetical protein
MTIIEVEAIMVDADGNHEVGFGGETGSTEFYMVKHTLEHYLGEEEESQLYYNHESKDTFIIDFGKGEENKNRINLYIDIIKNIYEAFDRNRYLRFEIINVE